MRGLPESAASTERIAETRRLARENGREVQVWTPVGIICRPTRREADEYMRYLVDMADRAAIGNVIDILAKDTGARTDPESVARRNGEGLIAQHPIHPGLQRGLSLATEPRGLLRHFPSGIGRQLGYGIRV